MSAEKLESWCGSLSFNLQSPREKVCACTGQPETDSSRHAETLLRSGKNTGGIRKACH
jgi:hypothetical protein